LYQFVEVIDTLPVLYIPDLVLNQAESQKSIDLDQYIFNIDDYDTLYFSIDSIFADVDTAIFSNSFDSLSLVSYLSTNLSDTGTVVLKYNCHFDDNVVSDTVTIRLLLPELIIDNVSISDTIISNAEEQVISYDLMNHGNYHAGSYEVRYYISEDSLTQNIDNCLGSKNILFHPTDSILDISDTLQLPFLGLLGDYYLIIAIDALNQISEIDESNNLEVKAINLNPPPGPPQIITAIAEGDAVHLTWRTNFQPDITGFKIQYGQDTTTVLINEYTLSSDTTYTISGLQNNNIYYFAVSAYKLMGVESERSVFVPAETSFKAVSLKVFLEGSFDGESLMNTILKDEEVIPLSHPYTYNPWLFLESDTITEITNHIVDWVLVELRETTGDSTTATEETMIARQAAFLKNDGSIVSRFGSDILSFDVEININLYVVIYHRNHLSIMSANPLIESGGAYTYDFTESATQTYGGINAVKELSTGIWGMIAADGNADGTIDNLDLENSWAPQAGEAGYNTGDFNLDTQVDNKDKDDVWVPNDGEGSQVPE